jgi:hypothetical protein
LDTYLTTHQLDDLLFLIDDVEGLENLTAHVRDILEDPEETNMVTIMYDELSLLADTLEDLHDWIPLVAQIDDYLREY